MNTTKLTFGKYFLLSFLAIGLALSSCKKDETVDPTPLKPTPNPVDPFIVGAVHAKKQIPLVNKATGENCPPCGDWGWTAWEQISTSLAGKAFCFANYAGSYAPTSGFKGNELNKPNSDATPMLNNFSGITGYPNFVTNCTSHGTSKSNAENAANTSISTPENDVKASASFKYKIDGDQLTIKAEMKIYKNLTGKYYMAAYLVENDIKAYQAGNSAGANARHHLVFRGSLSSNTWGEKIVDGSVFAGDVFGKTYTVTIPSDYNKDNLTYGVVLWKKNGGRYVYINAATNQKAH